MPHTPAKSCLGSLRTIGTAAVCFLGLAISGCGASQNAAATAAEAESHDQKKIQDLAKKGMNFTEIRKTLRGEPIDPRTKTKKKAGSH
jgi:hypothetical protein